MRGAIAVAAACVAVVLPHGAEAAPLCNWEGYVIGWCGGGYTCPEGQSCKMMQSFWCGNQQPAGDPSCAHSPCLGCDGNDDANTFSSCTRPGGPEDCGPDGSGNGIDDDYDGCADEGCTEGEPPCTCEKSCERNRQCHRVGSVEGERTASPRSSVISTASSTPAVLWRGRRRGCGTVMAQCRDRNVKVLCDNESKRTATCQPVITGDGFVVGGAHNGDLKNPTKKVYERW